MSNNQRIGEWLGYRVDVVPHSTLGRGWELTRPNGTLIDTHYESSNDAWDLLPDFERSDTAALECDDKLHAEGAVTLLCRGNNGSIDEAYRYQMLGGNVTKSLFAAGPTRAAAITGAVLKMLDSLESKTNV